MQEKVKQLVLNDKPIEESGLSYTSFSKENFPHYLIWKFLEYKIESDISQIEKIFDALFEHSKIKSLKEIDKLINKYKNDIKHITDSIDLIHQEKDKYNWSPSLIVSYVIAIEDKGFRNTLTLQHEREVLEKIISKRSFNKWFQQLYESRKV